MLATATLLLVSIVLAACGPSTSSLPGKPRDAIPSDVAPLASSFATSTASWVDLPMGTSGLNRFWELFSRSSGTGTWALVTPPGVADNGGLVVASTPEVPGVVAGFIPSQYLSSSPLESSADAGRNWEHPAMLAGGLVPGPSSLSLITAGSVLGVATGRAPGSSLGTVNGVAALTTAHGGQVVAGPLTGATWRGISDLADVKASAAGERCRPSRLTGISSTQTGTLLLAATCARAGVIGVLRLSGSTWQLASPAVPATGTGHRLDVLRLARVPGGTAALVSWQTSRSRKLMVAWSEAGGSGWSQTAPLGVPAGSVVDAIGLGPSGTFEVLLTRSANKRRSDISLEVATEATGALRGTWTDLPPPPPGSVAVAGTSRGGALAFTASGTSVEVFALPDGESRWRLSTHMHVKLPYTSST
jgi:hypothetical protein